MKLSPLKTSTKTTNTLYSFDDGNTAYVVKCYVGADNLKRCRREKDAIEHWAAAGFNVPRIYDRTIPNIHVPYLVLSRIEGVPLREYLSSRTRPIDEKLRMLENLFEQTSSRHRLAVQNADFRLVHYDPSSGNVICFGDRLSYVDFEARPRYRTVIEAAGTELLTLCKWIVRDMGMEFLETVMQLVTASYKNQQSLLRVMLKRTSGRPFQFYHRWKIRKRKTANPNDVTKYDIADTVEKLLREA